ncbi:MAG TPA: hypothetical protein VK470_06015 [Bacteroidota bacterium]|nr:hypothetical protein [Bacteroidota bacterium]
MPRIMNYIVGVLFVLRVGLSFALSDGLFKSDSITYFGAVVNLGLNGSISSIQPEDDRFARGARGDELFDHLSMLSNPVYRPLPYQWLHTAIYAPILFFWKSLTPVILINNLLFFAAGFLLFRGTARETSLFAQSAGWIIYAFFPPFFYLTSQFFSEPLFLFFFAGVLLLIDKLGWEQFYLLFIFAAAVSLTRPFGLVIVSMLVVYAMFRHNYARAFGLACAVMLAMLINMIVMMHAVPDNARTFAVSAAETVYYSNTTGGNGDFDYYLAVPLIAERDTTLQRYRSGAISGGALIAEAMMQNFRAPGRLLRNTYYKFSNYFFSIVPDRWIYTSVGPQSPMKKALWIGQNIILFALAGVGLFRARKSALELFLFVFGIGLVFHFFLLSRYRYFLPILVYAAAFTPLAIEWLIKRRLNR